MQSDDMRAELEGVLENNRAWAARMAASDPGFFEKLAHAQRPQFLWIGCSDSRVPANQIVGLAPGEIFVHRNVANLISLTDFNCLSVVQYAVEILKVRHIIVSGHYGCGGVLAALEDVDIGLVNNWLSPIHEIMDVHEKRLAEISEPSRLGDKLCELNVVTQVRNLCRSAIIRRAWQRRQPLAVHGMIYGLNDGILHDLYVNAVSHSTAESVCQMAMERVLSAPGRVTD